MSTEISIYVQRPQSEYSSSPPLEDPENSQIAWDEHRRRAAALHEILDANPDLRVIDWGNTDDRTRTHESVQVIIDALAGGAGAAAAAVGLTFGKVVLEVAIEEALHQPVRRLIRRLIGKQKAGEITFVSLTVKDGTTIHLSPSESGSVSITTSGAGGSGTMSITFDEAASNTSGE